MRHANGNGKISPGDFWVVGTVVVNRFAQNETIRRLDSFVVVLNFANFLEAGTSVESKRSFVVCLHLHERRPAMEYWVDLTCR